jgi:lysozyme family protein
VDRFQKSHPLEHAMAASTYDDALRRVLAHEGGYTNHPSDPGGPTNFGITIADYRKYVKPNATAADVEAMRADEAKAIYRTKYWDAMRCDDLPAGVDYAVFDYGVNSGIGRAQKVLERIIETRSADGKVSDAELSVIRKKDARTLINGICDERLAFLKSLRTWAVFGNGWSRRVAEVRTAALAMSVARATRPMPSATAAAKAIVPLNAGAQKGSAGAAVVAGLVAARQAHASGTPAVGVALIVAATFAIGVGVWLFWHLRQRRQQQAPMVGR